MENNNKYIFSERPMLVYWEITRSCDLACKHCRAEAQHTRNSLELQGDECYSILDQVKSFGAPYPQIVLTGGDPLNHPDWEKILIRANEIGISVAFAPSATHNLTKEVFQRLKDLGVPALSLSLDGATSQSHDTFRGVEHCFEYTMQALGYAQEVGIPIQINTLVSGNTLHELEDIYNLLTNFSIMRWSVFFLISVGRGTALKELTAEKTEEVLEWITAKAKTAPFAIKTTEAPHYRRIFIQKMKKSGDRTVKLASLPVSRGFGIRDGNGIMFISHLGDVNPSGFLNIKAGNVRQQNLVDIYRNSEVFSKIRNPENYVGKCGICEYKYICGGSRARAYAATGNYLASDNLCSYEPAHAKEENLAAVLQEI